MSIYRNQYDSYADNTYQSIPSNLTYNQQRNFFKNASQKLSSYNDLPSLHSNYGPINSPPNRNGLKKLNEYRSKVSQVIDLCKRQNTEIKGQFGQVVGQERQIYNLLVNNPTLLHRTLSQQNIPQTNQYMGQTLPYSRLQRPNQSTSQFQTQKNQKIIQSNYFVPQFSQVNTKQNNYPQNYTYSKPVRPSSTTIQQQQYVNYLNQPFATFGSQDPSPQNLKNSLNKVKSALQLNLNDDALKMIEQIEKKAFNQIQKLRRQKLQLMQRLNQQIKNVNEQKKKNSQLSVLLKNSTTQPQRADGSYASGQNTQYFQTQIQRLESQLRRVNQLNHNLRLELSNKGSGVSGIEELLRQGELIRQQTLRLLKLKEQGQAGEKIQQLQRQLVASQSQKQAVLNQLKSIKQRTDQGNRNRPFKQIESFQKSAKVTSPQIGKIGGQYEDLVSEMKRLTGY